MESMQPPANKRRAMADINVVPYIDVMLVLLIIFMVTAPMLVQSVPVNLPDTSAAPTEIEPDDNALIISIDVSGKIYIERDSDKTPTAMTSDQVVEYVSKVKRQVSNTRVLIRADEAVPYGKVVVLMGGLNVAGVSDIGLITEAPDPES